MNVQIMQCPSCGSPLPAPAIGTVTSCTYCGARLEVTKGASGAPLAKLSEIKEDTSFIAKERAKEHLRGQIEKLGAEIASLESKAQAGEIQEMGCSNALFVSVGVVGPSGLTIGYFIADGAGFSSPLAWGLLGAVSAGVLVFVIMRRTEEKRRDRELREAAEVVAQPLARKRQELADAKDAMQRLEEDLNVLAKRL